ncbi:hypothetical protein D9619_004021 [Psilocybe cf. subviscida]|uniref:Uncharacterized protein n=1 Tax=Psilocybe cf. subviscida TaxID=2480587 RepID=A0A8H5F8Y5_9AGAR|nr:hypothetical protein D9619_004021 [Psilocybe cf. subviscida]
MGFHNSSPPGLRVDIACGTGFVVETGLFCAYTYLFIAALSVLTSARRLKDARNAKSAWVFLVFSILMYLVATTHLLLQGVRFYRSTFGNFDLKGRMSYLRNPNNWEFPWLLLLILIQTWLGDALVIYRCYFIWNNNLWLIFVPVCLLLGTIGIGTYVVYLTINVQPTINAVPYGLANSAYPLAFAQNFMTTSLIILKIVLQHRESKKAGILMLGSKLSLIRIVRIVIESAGIYTIQLLVLVILYFRSDTFQWVIQQAIVPSIGITFLLLAIRIEASRNHNTKTRSNLGIRSSMIPRWTHDPDREISIHDRQIGNSLPTKDDANVTEQRLAIAGESDARSINWDSTFSSTSAPRPKATASSSSSKYVSTYTSELDV